MRFHVLITACILFVSIGQWAMAELTLNKEEKTYKGYTLYTATEKKVVLLDMQGNEVHFWPIPYPEYASLAIGANPKPLANGNLLIHMHYDGRPGIAGAEAITNTLVELNWQGEIVWEYYDPAFLKLHHDFQRKRNGNTVILGSRERFDPDIAPHPLNDDIIREIDRFGNIVWEWSTIDHFDQLGFSPEGKAAIYNDDEIFIFHTNSLQVLPPSKYMRWYPCLQKGNILVSQRNTNKVFIIDRTTGDIVWRLEALLGYPDGSTPTIGQHDAQMIAVQNMDPQHIASQGNILLFDNGGEGGYPKQTRSYSRVLEIDPVFGNVKLVYAHVTKSVDDFFSLFMSSAQRLANGNTLIVEAENRRIFEVTPEGEIVWEYMSPYSIDIFRAYRVNSTWVAGRLAE
ncbi:MAG: hypothetical protein D3923_12220 [Candidatus Electrothrix sp. AR3]|nr:hypothetical protein [Candidatus Electrothrix sp. AR3]